MTRVTRNIELDEARPILEGGARASLGFALAGEPMLEPVAFVHRDGRYLAAMSSTARTRPRPGDEVVLLIDDGIYFFDLRAVYVRGRIEPLPSEDRPQDGGFWFEVEPTKVVAWDYGRMREVVD